MVNLHTRKYKDTLPLACREAEVKSCCSEVMAKKKKTPRYVEEEMEQIAAVEAMHELIPLVASLQTNPVRQTRDGNQEIVLNHEVAELDVEGHPYYNNNDLVRSHVTETYTFNAKHREQHLANSGYWKATRDQERESFQTCRANGAFTKWKGNTHKGWGLVLDVNTSTPVILGQGVDSEGNMNDVKVCKFVEGNAFRWHGYPINYRSLDEETICDNALSCWANILKIIDKSEINDIKNREESSLS